MKTITNKSKRFPWTGILARGGDYSDHPACRPHKVTHPIEVSLPDGTKRVKHVDHVVPASITLQPGESMGGLPDSIEEAPDFRAAKEAGILSITTA